ncbi:VIT1/CCC1 transporter family protein [Candidatus Woesearchaeota archaeon]|nr:VIT1/CCC1 transporter family protein [Candidatus Woesearchaeota archaeon]
MQRSHRSKKSQAPIEQTVQIPGRPCHHEGNNHIEKTMRGVVFGVHDGVLTLLGFVSGAAGLLADNQIIFLTGLAGMVAEGISMGVGEYQSINAQNEILESEITKEAEEIKTIPDEEKKEVYTIYRNKGLTDKEAKLVTKSIIKDKRRWLNTMIVEELGLSPEKENPYHGGAIMAAASFFGGAIPLISYLFLDKTRALLLSVLLSMAVVFIVGAYKTKYTNNVWWKSGSSMMTIAMTVAILTYFIGLGIGKLGGVLF